MLIERRAACVWDYDHSVSKMAQFRFFKGKTLADERFMPYCKLGLRNAMANLAWGCLAPGGAQQGDSRTLHKLVTQFKLTAIKQEVPHQEIPDMVHGVRSGQSLLAIVGSFMATHPAARAVLGCSRCRVPHVAHRGPPSGCDSCDPAQRLPRQQQALADAEEEYQAALRTFQAKRARLVAKKATAAGKRAAKKAMARR